MKCPYCKDHPDLKVIDSRPEDDGQAIKRRRECPECQRRYTTYERIELKPLYVVKKNGNRQLFDSNKVRNGIQLACTNRPVSAAKIDELIRSVEKTVGDMQMDEVPSSVIGNLVMDRLMETDEVSYVRFASVYRHFTDTRTFITEMQKLLSELEKYEGKKK